MAGVPSCFRTPRLVGSYTMPSHFDAVRRRDEGQGAAGEDVGLLAEYLSSTLPADHSTPQNPSPLGHMAGLHASEQSDDLDDSNLEELLNRLESAHEVAESVESRLDSILERLGGFLECLEQDGDRPQRTDGISSEHCKFSDHS